MPPFIPLKKLITKSPKKFPSPPKRQQKKFYYLAGEITLIHAGIEQDLKDVLIEDWEVPEEKVERLYGKELRKFYLKKLKELSIPKVYWEEFSKLMNRFEEASEKRNDIIKATYGYLSQTKEIFRYDLKLRRNSNPAIDSELLKKKWMKIVTFDELDDLSLELGQIREMNFQLCKGIFLEKSAFVEKLKRLGVPIPSHAIKNPYKYIADQAAQQTNENQHL